MRTLLLLVLILSIKPSDVCVAGPASTSDARPTEYTRMIDLLTGIRIDLSAVAEVEQLVLVRETATFTLTKGRLFGCTPIDGRRVAVLFHGKGTFTMKPPTLVEQQQLYRFYEQDSVRKDFTTLFLLFADSTWEELQHRVLFAPAADPFLDGAVKYAMKYLHDDATETFHEGALWTFLHKQRNALFHAHFSEVQMKPLFFEVNPFDEEEVTFAQRGESGVAHDQERITQSHTLKEYRDGTAGKEEDKSLARITDYVIDAHVADNLKFSATTTVILQPRADSLRWLPFWLFSRLDVESADWSTDGPAEYVRGDDSPVLWVRMPSSATRGRACSLVVRYRGDLLEKDDFGWIGLRSSSSWYPRYGDHAYANFAMTFHTPAKWKFAASAERLAADLRGDTLVTRWKTVRPAHNVSFSIGQFQEIVLEDDNRQAEHSEGEALPAVVVYAFENTPAGLGFARLGEEVRMDMLNAMRFYQYLYGKSPVNTFYATETPHLHGEAFPGLIHLSWATFKYADSRGSNEVFRGHEVAHQWWGVGVKYRTYHDQWLSEALSEYSGLWFMQAALKDNEKFFDALEQMKKRILGARKYVLGSGQESGPIWLGYRTQSSNTKGDYGLIVYQKGAWVIHMLRNMLLDLKTMKEDRFIGMMHDFYARYLGKEATTADFQRVVEKHIGGTMDWFFKEWIMDTKIPSYRVATRHTVTPEGKYLVTCRVRQDNVARDFAMPVVVLVKFSGDRYVRLRIMVTGDREEYQLPLLPLEPEEIIFNDLSSVLCEVEEEDWE